jgi:hypothetical protein
MEEVVIKYNLEEYFGIDVEMKVSNIEFGFYIYRTRLDSPMLSWKFYYTISNLRIQKFLVNLIAD